MKFCVQRLADIGEKSARGMWGWGWQAHVQHPSPISGTTRPTELRFCMQTGIPSPTAWQTSTLVSWCTYARTDTQFSDLGNYWTDLADILCVPLDACFNCLSDVKCRVTVHVRTWGPHFCFSETTGSIWPKFRLWFWIWTISFFDIAW